MLSMQNVLCGVRRGWILRWIYRNPTSIRLLNNSKDTEMKSSINTMLPTVVLDAFWASEESRKMPV
jgi:hypothetical protein